MARISQTDRDIVRIVRQVAPGSTFTVPREVARLAGIRERPACAIYGATHRFEYLMERGPDELWGCACGAEAFNAREANLPTIDPSDPEHRDGNGELTHSIAAPAAGGSRA